LLGAEFWVVESNERAGVEEVFTAFRIAPRAPR
jgi:hypothetical protein